MASAEDFEFEGPVAEWRGPSPYFFVAVPELESEDIKFAAKSVEVDRTVTVALRVGRS